MNAPAKATQLQPSAYRPIALADIAPSPTHIQAMRRARFNPERLAELVASVRELGVLEPILVRPNPDVEQRKEDPTFEIVAGERRWLAAKAAGLDQIACVVREVRDTDLVKVQLIENLQWEGLHEMEEAEGYAQLMHESGISADAVADMIGKSRSYVYGRLKLLKLLPDARDAFYSGALDASRALELARIAEPKQQARILKLALEKNWNGDGPAYSVRNLRQKIAQAGLTQPLDRAPFAPDNAGLLRFIKRKKGIEDCEALPACVGCPMRAGAGSDDDPDVCTDTACYEDKVKDLHRRQRAEAEAAGRTIVKVDAGRGADVPGYIDLDAEADCDDYPEPEPNLPDSEDDGSPEFRAYEAARAKWEEGEQAWRARTYRQILADTPLEPTLVEDKRGALREMLPVKEAKKLLERKGVQLPWQFTHNETPATRTDPAKIREEDEKRRTRQEAETAYRRRLLKAVYDKWKPPIKRVDLIEIAEGLLDGRWGDGLIAIFGNTPPVPAKLAEDALARLIVILQVADEADNTWHAPTNLLALAKRLKLDPAKIRKDLAAEARAKTKPAAPTKDKQAAKKKVVKK